MLILNIKLLLIHCLKMGDVVCFGASDLTNHDDQLVKIKTYKTNGKVQAHINCFYKILMILTKNLCQMSNSRSLMGPRFDLQPRGLAQIQIQGANWPQNILHVRFWVSNDQEGGIELTYPFSILLLLGRSQQACECGHTIFIVVRHQPTSALQGQSQSLGSTK